MRKYIPMLCLAALSAVCLVSCKQQKRFEVSGQFTSATDQVVYLEQRTLDGTRLLDSAVLKADGRFRFRQPAPSNPEFYQLRVNGQLALFAVDSAERVQVRGDVKELQTSFAVENSPTNDQLRLIDNQTRSVKSRIDRLERSHTAGEVDDMAFLAAVDSILRLYKADVTQVIIGNPAGAAAYYGVFQKVNDYLIFDPYNKQDYPMFGAVATSWQRYYPETERAKHLYAFTMNALKTRKQQEHYSAWLENAPVTTGADLPDILLPGVDGGRVSLASLQGKVVLLDFTVYAAEFSPAHNVQLNNLYRRLAADGLEIYQVSFDSDEHFWKNAANNLPWVTVRDPQSVNSQLLGRYNVREIPTAFVLNRQGNIVARVENYDNLDDEVRRAM